MKKFICSFLMIACCLVCFAGCGESLPESFWQDTSKNLTEYYQTQEFQSSFSTSYNSNLNTIMSQDYGKIYLELKDIYVPLYEQSMFCAQKYTNVFLAQPTNNSKKLKSKFVEINKKLNELKNEVTEFENIKSFYLSNIDFTDEQSATSRIEIARLNKFKQNYLSLIKKAYNLSVSIYDAYTEGYYSFIDLSKVQESDLTLSQIEINLKLALNGSNLQLTNSSINVLSLYLNKEVENDYNQFWQSSQKFYKDALQLAYQKDLSGLNVSTMYNKLKIWQGVYMEFVEDSSIFNDVLKDIDVELLKKYNNDTFAYAQATKEPTDQGKATFFLNYNKNIDLLFEYASNLIKNI